MTEEQRNKNIEESIARGKTMIDGPYPGRYEEYIKTALTKNYYPMFITYNDKQGYVVGDLSEDEDRLQVAEHDFHEAVAQYLYGAFLRERYELHREHYDALFKISDDHKI